MKIKIKNFVFAGFAAAIFAGNAMAAGDTIVTSKAYVDQKLGLKANTADLADVATSGDYGDLLNKPTIPTVPTNVSAFTNDANYITSADVPAQVQSNWTETNTTSKAYIQNKPTLATVATSGSYNDLSNKPTIPSAVSDLTNDTGFITSAQVPAQVNADWTATSGAAQILNKPTLAAVATSGNYSDLSGTPTLATVATSGSYTDLADKPTIPAAQVQSDWNATTGMGAILNKPTLGSAAAADTTDFATAAQGTLADTAVQPSDLATVATSGSYNDLSNKPTIPAAQVNADWNSTSGVSQILNKPTLSAVATSGNYSDLSGTPNLATVATSGSYTDLADKPTIPAAQVQSDWNATTGMGAILNKPTLSAVATSGNYSDLSGTPTLATVATSGSYTDLSDKPTIPSAVSDLTNDSGFITSAQVPAQVQSNWTETNTTSKAYIQNKPTLGTAAAAATTDFATAAQGALAETAIQPGTCTADAPCAMVNNQWVRIAQVGD